MTRFLPLTILTALATALAGCGGDKEEAALTKACPTPPPAMKGVPTVPGNFPMTKGLVYTGIKKAGPSTLVSGYFASAISDAHTAFATSIKGGSGYSVTKEEQDKADAEVNFSGGSTSGQVKLVQTCKSRTNVTITIRPA